MNKEATARVKINKLLEESGWILAGNNSNVTLESNIKDLGNDFEKTAHGFADYVLLDDKKFPLCVLEAKKESINPLSAKEQTRNYANKNGARFIILSNGNVSYLWDLKAGNPQLIIKFPTQQELMENEKWQPNPKDLIRENIDKDYIASTQYSNLQNDPNCYNFDKTKLKFLRDYQIKAIKSIQNAVENNKNRFLLEMATGTGKTLTTAGIIKLFLTTDNARRILFLVDRIELENQAERDFTKTLGNGFKVCIYKENRDNWNSAQIVISTIQTMLNNDHFKIFKRSDFDLVISDEAHRSISGNQRVVFEYFNGYKLGLTATPRNYLKNAGHTDDWEERTLRDTYNTFGCESGEPTFQYSLNDGVRDGYLIPPFVIDARTEITTDLLSKEGYNFKTVDENNEEVEKNFKKSAFERKFFSNETNYTFCRTFLQNALRDPWTNEIGKTLFFCVSQEHAAKITQILSELMSKEYPQSDFAIQVTSQIPQSQDFTRQFTKDVNKLMGKSEVLPDYDTSKARVCCTVGMMTTGYDCEDLLNIVLCRPIMSPSEFIQIKGRGTRKSAFKYNKEEKPKTQFYLFDYFANCEYFEKDFNYNEILNLPKQSVALEIETPRVDITNLNRLENFSLDPEKIKNTYQIGIEGMRIDREMFGKIKDEIKNDETIKQNFENLDFIKSYLESEKFNKPAFYYNWEKLRKLFKADYRATPKELIECILFNKQLSDKETLLNQEFDNFILSQKIIDEAINTKTLKDFFVLYLTSQDFKTIIDNKNYVELDAYMNFTIKDLKSISKYKDIIPEYIKDNSINFDKFNYIGA